MPFRFSQYFLVSFCVLQSICLKAQVTVSGSTGANGTYTSLTKSGGAFAAINSVAASQTGKNIVITITSNITTENGANNLNSGLWNSIIIKPNGQRTVSGSINSALIEFTGADNVIIDGLNSGGNSLTISNTSTSTSSGTSAIRFVSDASDNKITNCTISGSSRSTTNGVVIFSSGISTGNDNDTLLNNIISEAGTNEPANGIYSAGSSATVNNSDIVILDNEILNYYMPTTASNGILLASNSSSWSIIGNKFYQTATRTCTSNGFTHKAINIVTPAGINYSINNNVIGFANNSSTGTTTYNGAFANRFLAIELNVGTASASEVQGNIISGISLTTTSAATVPGIFCGISILAGDVNVGTTSGNTVGAATGNGSINVSSTTTAGDITGIYATSVGDVFIQNNLIGAISCNGTAAIGYDFNGIYTAGTAGNFTISSNTIGSTTSSNSISVGTSGVTTSGVCSFTGIRTTNTGIKTILDNTIQNCSVYGTGNSSYLGINNSGSSSTLRIRNNEIIAGTNTGSSTTSAGLFTCIVNSGVVTTANISLNVLGDHSRTNTTGLFTGISNTGTVTTSINIDSNQLGNSTGELITFSQANSIALLGISNTGGAISSSLSIQYNDIRGIVNSASATHSQTFIINSAAVSSQKINYNTFTNLSINTTGAVIFISNNVVMPANGTQNINYNSIVGSFTNSASGGSLTLFTGTSATASNNVSVNHNNNNLSNITVSGTASILGWISTDLGAGNVTRYLRNNVFRNWNAGTGSITVINVNVANSGNATNNNTIADMTCGGNITGILTGLASTGNGNDNIYSNVIDSLTSSGASSSVLGISVIDAGDTKNIYQNSIANLKANNLTTGTVAGISISGGLNNEIYQNKIYNLSTSSSSVSSGTINGILVSGSLATMVTTLKNNTIGELNAFAASSLDAIRGISIISTGTTSFVNVYFNTIYINASSSGSIFGTSGIYHTTNATSTTAALDMRNNIIVNASTPKSTGITAAYRRSSGTFANYSTNSDNNLFYAGTPGSSRVILYNGTGYQTLSTYKAIVGGGRDAASITDDMVTTSKFMSISGSSTNFLNIDSTKYCLAESAGANISGVTTDFEDNIRQGNAGYSGTGNAPDIGAYEFEGLWQWTGATNTSWANTGNWATSVVPNSGVSINLSTGLPNYPVLTSGTVAIHNLTLNSGTSLTVNNAELIISGNITNNGTFNATNGTVQFNGIVAQNIPPSVFSGNLIKNLTLNNSNGVSLNGTLGVTGILKATSGDFNTGGFLTLVSNSSGTALVDGSGGGEILGNLVMQRYLDSTFGYKYLSSPFQSSKVSELYDDIDFSPSFPVFYKYDENQSASGWITYTDTSQVLTPMKGYAVNFGSAGSQKTIDITGTVNNGSMELVLYNHNKSITQGFNLVGNPYPSPIDWNAGSGWTKTNIDNALYFFDAGSADEYLGTYSSYINGVSSNGIADNIIGSMQGFFVHTSNGSFPVTGTLKIGNGARVNNLTEILHKKDTQPVWPQLRLKCYFEGAKTKSDDAVFYLNNEFTSNFDKEGDALKLMNTNTSVPNLYGISDDLRKLSISAIPTLKDSLHIFPLGLNMLKGGKMIISLQEIIKWTEAYKVYLYDAQTRDLQNLKDNPAYSFVAKPGLDESRFSLVFSLKDIQYLSGSQNEFKVYERDGNLYFSLNPLIAEAHITLSNMMGQIVYKQKISGNTEQLLETTNAQGLYILSVSTARGISSRKIFISGQ